MRIMPALLILFIAFPAHARDKVLDIEQVTSPGGIKAWLVEDHSVPVIAMQFGFRGVGGALDPVDKQGLSRMLSNTLDEGAGELDSQTFQKELRDLSIGLSFGSDRDDFSGSLKTLSQNKKRAFELTALALTKPRFDEEPVKRMREANQSRIRSSLTDPDWMTARIMNDRAFEGHVYSQNSGGSLSSLEKISPEDLRAFHKNNIGKNNLVVAVSGDMTKEELATTLDNIFGDLPDVKPPAQAPDIALQNAGKVFVFKQDIPQTIVEMMQPGIDRHHPDYQLAQVMNFVLGSSGFGSRLTEEIREKRGLTYGIYSYFIDMKHFDGLQVSTSTETKNTAEMISLVKVEWEKMKNEPISEQELQDAKSYLIGSLPLGLTSTDDIAGLLLSLQMDEMPVDYLEQREDKIKNATAADVQRVAKELLDSNKMITVLTGNPENIAGSVPIEKLPNVE
ncbi:MAG: insulinase family protein [Micavibrio sp.]|nr:insulinase family protein [Micavibrio sp.]MBK9561814.1 insulinase family protein [Micavibrio sp.]